VKSTFSLPLQQSRVFSKIFAEATADGATQASWWLITLSKSKHKENS
jgi:hypothetical protein